VFYQSLASFTIGYWGTWGVRELLYLKELPLGIAKYIITSIS